MDSDEIPQSILEAQASLERARAEHREREHFDAVERRAVHAPPETVGASLERFLHEPPAGLLTEAEVEKLDEERDFGLWPDRLHASGIVPELHDDDFGRIVRNGCLPTRPMHIVRRWVAAHRRPKAGRPAPPSWLFVCGGVGVGKTVAAGHAISQIGGVYVTMQALLAEYVARSKRNNRDGDDPFPHRFERASLVVLDELGTERADQADLAREVVFRLVSRRQSRRRMTLVLTNDDTKACRARFEGGAYDVRAYSRLLPMWSLLDCGAESMRRERVQEPST